MSEATDAQGHLTAMPGESPTPRPPVGDLEPVQVLAYTGLAAWQWQAGTDAGLIPVADVAGRRWSIPAVDGVAESAAPPRLPASVKSGETELVLDTYECPDAPMAQSERPSSAQTLSHESRSASTA